VSDQDAVLAAVEEAQRILAEYDYARPRPNQDEVLNMIQFALCNCEIRAAIKRLKIRGCLRLVE